MASLSTYEKGACASFLVFLYVAVAAINAACLNYAVSFWLEYAGRPDTFHFWHAFLICLLPIVGQLPLAAAAATLIASFFV